MVNNNKPDVIITPSNYLKSFKRIAHCLKEQDKVNIGMTLKNKEVYDDLIKDLEVLDIKIKEVGYTKYKVSRYDAICITISKRK